MIYAYKMGGLIAVPAQVAGEVCEELERDGRLTPANLVDVSRPDDAPLHNAFEWDDAVAAEKYRVHQAGQIIRLLVTVPEKSPKDEPVRAFVPIASSDTSKRQSVYKGIERVLASRNDREQMLISARRELAAFKRKYESLSELSDVFLAIESFTGSLLQDEDAA